MRGERSSGKRDLRRVTIPGAASRAVALLAGLAALLAVLAGCAPSTQGATQGPARSGAARTVHATHAPATAATAATATRLGPADPALTLALAFPLAQRSTARLDALLAAISDPRSPLYQQYLTAAQYDAAYGPDQAQRDQATAALRALGFSGVATDAGSGLVTASATVRLIESTFGVTLSTYRAADGSRYIAPGAAPRLPATLAAAVTGVIGLDTRPALKPGATLRPRNAAQTSQTSQTSGGGLDPSALRQLYDVGPLISKGLDGSGETIALAEIDQYNQSDVAYYDGAFALNSPAPQVIQVGAAPKSASPEPVLDIEVLNAIAPKARLLVYESGSSFAALAAMFDHIVRDNKAQIVSISLGACEAGMDSSSQGFLTSVDNDFQRAGAQGMSVLVASGDSGAYGCQDTNLSVDLPGSSPYVTSVGGTAVFPGDSGSYGREDGWEGPLEGAGGGGGLSVIYQRPSWQTGPGVDNTYSNGMRQTPDVAADADPLTGYRIYYSGDGSCSGEDCWTVVGGTSAAAPFWAGLIALANQQGNRKLGFLNPALYAIGAASDSGGPAAFHDITGGGNLYYSATRGWDYSTGWGSPDAAVLVPALLAR